MIHVIIGGSCSGKTTYVRDTYLAGRAVEGSLKGVPITAAPTLAVAEVYVVGHYARAVRTCGLDQLGRDYDRIHERLGALIPLIPPENLLVMEGNAAADEGFLKNLAKCGQQCGHKVRLTLKSATVQEVRQRAAKEGLRYGNGIFILSYRRAWRAYQSAPKEWDREILR